MELIKIIRILTIILMIILAISVIYFKFGDCDKFHREINGTNVKADKFMKIYYKECLQTYGTIILGNLTVVQN
jgi:hypothetical protein